MNPLRWFVFSLAAGLACCAIADDKPVKIKPDEARKHVGKKVEVVFEVKAAKHSLKRKTVYLDSETDFRDEKNLGIAIIEQGIADLKQKKSIDEPADHFRDKKIQVVGTVVIEEERPYIKVDSADQIDLAKEES